MGRFSIAFIISLLLITAGGSFSLLLRHPADSSVGGDIDLESIPLAMGGWVAREIHIGETIERLLDVNQYIYREYVNESGVSAWLFVGYFTSQKFGSGIHSPRNCLPGSGWEIVNRTYTPLPGDSSITVSRMDILRGEMRQKMYYWFVTRAGHLNNEFSLKGELVKSAILGRPTDAAFIRINVSAEEFSPDEVDKWVEEFVKIFKKEVYTVLPFLLGCLILASVEMENIAAKGECR